LRLEERVEERKKIIAVLEQLRKEKEKLEAEKAFLEEAIKMKLKELRARPEKEETTRVRRRGGLH